MGSREATAARRAAALADHVVGPSVRDSDAAYAVVVGASVLDVHLTASRGGLVAGTTVPGRVAFQHGGVGRNIAECAARLGARVLLISAVGDDAAGREIVAGLDAAGVDTRGVKVCRTASTPAVACTFDDRGDLAHGVADTAMLESAVDAAWINRFAPALGRARVMLVEANLGECRPRCGHTRCRPDPEHAFL